MTRNSTGPAPFQLQPKLLPQKIEGAEASPGAIGTTGYPISDKVIRRFLVILGHVTPSAKAQGLLRTLWLAAIVIVVVGSLLPANSAPISALDKLHVNDKLEHFGAYAVLGFLPVIHERRRFIIVAAIGMVLLGVALEFAQLYSGWRDFEVGDMIADAVGVCLGCAAGIPVRSTVMIGSFRSSKNLRARRSTSAS